MFDYVLKNGQIIDPKNKIISKLNIGIKDGKIKALLQISPEEMY